MVDWPNNCYLNTMAMKRVKEWIKKYRWALWVLLIFYSLKGIAVLYLMIKAYLWING
jgi:hypothetical protein